MLSSMPGLYPQTPVAPPPPVMSVKTGHCHMSPEGQNGPLLSTTALQWNIYWALAIFQTLSQAHGVMKMIFALWGSQYTVNRCITVSVHSLCNRLVTHSLTHSLLIHLFIEYLQCFRHWVSLQRFSSNQEGHNTSALMEIIFWPIGWERERDALLGRQQCCIARMRNVDGGTCQGIEEMMSSWDVLIVRAH